MASPEHLGGMPTLEVERKAYNSVDCVEQLLFIEVKRDKFGGFKKGLLVSPLNKMQKEFFICRKCKGLMRNACQIEQGQTPVCKGCVLGKVKFHPMMSSQKMIHQLQVHCPLSTRGCKWNGTIAKIEVHVDACTKFIVKCPNACDVILPQNELSEHLKQSCAKQIVDCGHCQESVMYKDLTQHYDVCVEFPLFCPNLCDAYLMRKQVNTHIDTDCPNTLVECPYRKFGCEQDVKRCELEEHNRVNEILHLQSATLFAVNKMEQMEKKIISSDSTIQRMENEIASSENAIEDLEEDIEHLRMDHTPLSAFLAVENRVLLLKTALERSLYPIVLRGEYDVMGNMMFFQEDIEDTITVTITMKNDELRPSLAFEGRFKLTILSNIGTQDIEFETGIVQLQPEYQSFPKGEYPSSHVITEFYKDSNFKRQYIRQDIMKFTLQMQETEDKSIMESM